VTRNRIPERLQTTTAASHRYPLRPTRDLGYVVDGVVTREVDVVGEVLVRKGDYETALAMELRKGLVSANAGMGVAATAAGYGLCPCDDTFRMCEVVSRTRTHKRKGHGPRVYMSASDARVEASARIGEGCRHPSAVSRQCADKRALSMTTLAHTRVLCAEEAGSLPILRTSLPCVRNL